jgi:hypothetical protein
MKNTLEFKQNNGLPYYALNGIPVHVGDTLQILTLWGWHTGRFEWSLNASDPPHVVLNKGAVFAVGPEDFLRWPEETSESVTPK